jgi:photosystem II stability/assembly factor-like uncharacterized protein
MASHLLFAQPVAASCPRVVFDPAAPETVLVGLSDPLSDLQIDPLNPANLYAGTWNGVMKSTDGGTTWKSSGLGDSNVDAIAVNPRAPSIIFARASRLDGFGWPGAVFKSVNGGADWTPANEGLPERGVLPLWYSPDETDVVYAGTSTGLFKTTDGGRNWGPSSIGLPAGRVAAMVIDGQNSAILYLAPSESSGLFKSADAGLTWRPTGAGLPARRILSLVQDPSRGRLYAATAGDGLYASSDDDATWSHAGLANHHLCRVAVSPWDPRTLYAIRGGAAGSTVLFNSTDDGVSWTEIDNGLPEIFTFH